MALFRTGNPTLGEKAFQGQSAASQADAMTVQGTVNKTFVLLLMVLAPAIFTWTWVSTNPDLAGGFAMGGAITGFVFALITMFKKQWSPYTAPAYALAEGLFLGAISCVFEMVYPGIVLQASLLTIGTLFCLLLAYKSGWIRATENFKLGVVAATGGVAIVYLMTMILGWFGMHVPFIHENGMIGILFSLAVVVIAALNLVLDFDFIEQGAEARAPRYMEWYAAFGLLVTLIWLYVEFLRLLSKLRSR